MRQRDWRVRASECWRRSTFCPGMKSGTEEWTGFPRSKRESSMCDSCRIGSSNAGFCHGRKGQAHPTWVRPGVPSDSLRGPAFTRGPAGACVALLRLLSWYCLLGVVIPVAVQCCLADNGGFLCFYTQSPNTHTVMPEVVMDVLKCVPFCGINVHCESSLEVLEDGIQELGVERPREKLTL